MISAPRQVPKSWPLLLGALLLFPALVVLAVDVVPELLADTSGLDREAQAVEVGRVRTATLALLAGGIAVIGALYTARTYGLNQRSQISDRFIRAVEQLGHESLDVRVGGVYALERVAHESGREHGPVMEVLAAFVRRRSRSREPRLGPEPSADVTAAMTVLERRNRAFDVPGIEFDLTYADLTYLKLRAEADLRGMTFAHASLDHAVLRDVDLTGVDLQGASLEYARLERARLTGCQLLGATLTRAVLFGADLRDATLSGATLRDAMLSRAKLQGADLGAYFGEDRLGEVVSYGPAAPGAIDDGGAADFVGAAFDESTRWPPEFDPVARGAEAA